MQEPNESVNKSYNFLHSPNDFMNNELWNATVLNIIDIIEKTNKTQNCLEMMKTLFDEMKSLDKLKIGLEKD